MRAAGTPRLCAGNGRSVPGVHVKRTRARCRELRKYHATAHVFVTLFHDKWLDRPNDLKSDMVQARDFSALNGLGTSFERVERMRIVAFGRHSLLAMIAAVFVPLLPLVLLNVPMAKVARRLGTLAFGL